MKKQVWIGLFGLKIRPDIEEIEGLEGCSYAYVNALGYVESKSEFLERTAIVCEQLGFTIDEIDDVEPLAVRLQNCSDSRNLNKLAEKSICEDDIVFTTFHGVLDGEEKQVH